MLWPDSVVIDGNPISLADVLADVIIHHGRTGVFDDATATTAQITLWEVDKEFAKAFRPGLTLAITAKNAAGTQPRFTGRVTDATLDVDRLTVIGTGILATLTDYQIGLTGTWPVETWSARINRIFTEAGLGSLLRFIPDPDFDPTVSARDSTTAGSTTLGDYLTFLAPMVGASVHDGLDGTIVVEAVGSRRIEDALAIAPEDVAYAPIWSQVLPRGNIVTVRYTGDQSESVTVTDNASVGLYGTRYSTLDTTFTDVAAATDRANTLLSRGAYSHWNVLEAPILRGLQLTIGQPLMFTQLPPAAPYDPWMPILEGWQDEISGDQWFMLLALSDPAFSGLSLLPWDAVPTTGYAWNQVDPATAWYEALSLDDLTPAALKRREYAR